MFFIICRKCSNVSLKERRKRCSLHMSSLLFPPRSILLVVVVVAKSSANVLSLSCSMNVTTGIRVRAMRDDIYAENELGYYWISLHRSAFRLTSTGSWERLQSALSSCFAFSSGHCGASSTCLTPTRTHFVPLLSFAAYLVPGCVLGSTHGNNFRGNFVAIGQP